MINVYLLLDSFCFFPLPLDGIFDVIDNEKGFMYSTSIIVNDVEIAKESVKVVKEPVLKYPL